LETADCEVSVSKKRCLDCVDNFGLCIWNK